MQAVPLNPVPFQQIYTALNGAEVQIDVRQRRTGLFCDFYVNNELFAAGCIAQDRNFMIRMPYKSAFSGDLAFVDMQGTNDPTVDGLGTRFRLFYFAPCETPFDSIVPD